MVINIDLKTNIVSYSEKPKYQYRNEKRMIWGDIYLIDNRPFSALDVDLENTEFDDLIPRLTGNFFILEKEINAIRCATEFYGHGRYYYSQNDNELCISDYLNQLNVHSSDYNYFQILYFLSNGFTRNGNTFFNDVHIFTPSKAYIVKKNEMVCYFLPMIKKPSKESLSSIVSPVLKGILDVNPNSGLMFSSGIDSTYLSVVAKKNSLPFHHYFCKINRPILDTATSDFIMCKKIEEKSNVDVTYCEMDAYDDLKESITESLELLPFDFHISLFQRAVEKRSMLEGDTMIVTGQNSDSLYNYGNTTFVPIKTTLSALLKLRLRGAGFTILFNRYLQSHNFQKSVSSNSINPIVKKIWNRVANCNLNERSYLRSFIISNDVLPKSSDNTLDLFFINGKCSVYEDEIEREVDDIIATKALDENLHQMLLRSKLISHCQGRDVRCMTEWAKFMGIRNCQIFSTAPVFTYLANLHLTMKDVYKPKYELRQMVNKILNYSKLQSDIPEHFSGGLCSEKEYLISCYDELDEVLDKKKYVRFLIAVLKNNPDIDVEKLERLCEEDKLFAFRAFWAGYTLLKYAPK